MSEPIIYKGRGNPEMYDDLMDFLNYVFGFNGNDRDFKKMLPKLYKPEYNPSYANYVVTENGKLKAAIGAFDSVLAVGEEKLICRGIGNVAVHPYSRSKGYMKECINMAIDDMIKDGVDYSVLGGRRQRYNFFGFENAGVYKNLSISNENIKYKFDGVPFTELDFHPVRENETELIDKIYALHQTRPIHTDRPRAHFYDICRTGPCQLMAIFKKD